MTSRRLLSAMGTMPTSQVALTGGTGAGVGGKQGCVTFFGEGCPRYRACRAACLRRPLRLRWYFWPASLCLSRFASAAHSAEQYWHRRSHCRHRRNSPPHRGHRRSNRSTGRQRPRDWTSSATRAIQDLVGASCLARGHLRGLGAANSPGGGARDLLPGRRCQRPIAGRRCAGRRCQRPIAGGGGARDLLPGRRCQRPIAGGGGARDLLPGGGAEEVPETYCRATAPVVPPVPLLAGELPEQAKPTSEKQR
jgi:hypothetical protein